MGVLKTFKAFKKRLKGGSANKSDERIEGDSKLRIRKSIGQHNSWEHGDNKGQDSRRIRASALVEDCLNRPVSSSTINQSQFVGTSSERRNDVGNSTVSVSAEPTHQDTLLPPLKRTASLVPEASPVPQADTTLVPNYGTTTPQDSVFSSSSRKPSPASTIDLKTLAHTKPETAAPDATDSDQGPKDRPMTMQVSTPIGDEVGKINKGDNLSVVDALQVREMLKDSRSKSSSSEYSDGDEVAPAGHALLGFHPRSARNSSPPIPSRRHISASTIPQDIISATESLSRLVDSPDSTSNSAVPVIPGKSSMRASYLAYNLPKTTLASYTRESKRASLPETSHRYDSVVSSPFGCNPTPSLAPAPYHRSRTPASTSTYSTTHDRFLSLIGPSLPHENPKRYALRRRNLLASVHLAEHHLVEAPHTPRGSVIMERLNELEKQIEVEERRERRRRLAARAHAAMTSTTISGDGNGVAVATRTSHVGGARDARERKKPVIGVHCANDVRLGFQGAWSRGYSEMEEHPFKARNKKKKEKKDKKEKKEKK